LKKRTSADSQFNNKKPHYSVDGFERTEAEMMNQAILVEPVLVGRECEIEELMRYLDSAIQGKGRTVFARAQSEMGSEPRQTTSIEKRKSGQF
jgi:hypothetical protein